MSGNFLSEPFVFIILPVFVSGYETLYGFVSKILLYTPFLSVFCIATINPVSLTYTKSTILSLLISSPKIFSRESKHVFIVRMAIPPCGFTILKEGFTMRFIIVENTRMMLLICSFLSISGNKVSHLLFGEKQSMIYCFDIFGFKTAFFKCYFHYFVQLVSGLLK